ncbi:MAG: carbohydrate deacetylase [Cyanobium sp.]
MNGFLFSSMGTASYLNSGGPRIPVIINADDFGYSSNVNACIVDGIHRGCVSSATIMANGQASEEALVLATRLPQASFGVHLNLTEFRPLHPSQVMKSLGVIDADDLFRGNEFRKLYPSPKLMQACFDELDQQLQAVYSKGVRPSHLDSHHHIHTIPWLLPVIFSIQRKFKISKLRTTMNVYSSGPFDQPSRKLLAAKRIWQIAARSMGFKMTQRFTSLQIFSDDSMRPEFAAAQSIELMCHPGQQGFEIETEHLLSRGPEVLPSQYELVNYNQYLN